jgi:DNA-binding transcriptional regulator YiaG
MNSNNSDNRPLFQLTKEELMQDFEQVVRKVVNQMQVEQQASKSDKLTYTRDETAEILNVSLTTLHNWNKKGILKPTTKIGKFVHYSKSDIQARLNP